MKSYRNFLGAVFGWGATGSIAVLFLSGCLGAGSPQGPGGGVTGAGTTLAANVLRVGDRVTITFSGISTPPPQHQQEIRSDGYVTPPMLPEPGVVAAGKSTSELQQELQRLYVPGIFKAITITVDNPERYFFVGGEVRGGGQKPHVTEMTVVKAIQAAGDCTDFANKSAVIVTRVDGATITVNYKKAIKNSKYDAPVYPGDTIYVPRRFP